MSRFSPHLALLILLFSCTQNSGKRETDQALPAGYLLEDRTEIVLPKDLKEISGIAWYKTELLAVEDESSAIYRLDPQTGKIRSKSKFAKNEDIEDILLIGDTVWVLRSNGDLYQVTNFESEAEIQTAIFEYPIRESRDFEALTSSVSEPILWIFCKFCEWDSDETSVFRFNRETKEFDSKPELKIGKEDLKNLLSKEELRKLKLQPSAAAIHPLTNDYFLLSSAGKWLMTLDKSLKPISMHLLNSSLFPQPEGMTFDPEGNLYISNEGGDGKANILIFRYRP